MKLVDVRDRCVLWKFHFGFDTNPMEKWVHEILWLGFGVKIHCENCRIFSALRNTIPKPFHTVFPYASSSFFDLFEWKEDFSHFKPFPTGRDAQISLNKRNAGISFSHLFSIRVNFDFKFKWKDFSLHLWKEESVLYPFNWINVEECTISNL